MNKIWHRWYYFISFIPLWVLIFGNLLQNTLFSHGLLTRGFIEDYPALWLTAIGFVLNAALLKKYKGILRRFDLNIFKKRFGVLTNSALLIIVFFINHQWVVSQLNDGQITWFTYKGQLPYLGFQLKESFNVMGLIYYIVSTLFWMILLMLFAYLVSSLIILWSRSRKQKDMSLDLRTYFIHSEFVLISYLFFYISLQINDILLEGLDTFNLHGNRMVMLSVALVLLLIYTIASTLLRFQTSNTTYPIKEVYKREVFIDLFIILIPFTMIIFYIFFLQRYLDHESYQLKSVLTFSAFLLIIMVVTVNQHFKIKRFESLRAIVNENKTLKNYTHTVESLYHEMRHYKHDFNNILISLKAYFEAGDYTGLTTYYNEEVMTITESQNPHFQIVNQLTELDNIPLKGLLISKLGHLPALGIQVNLDINHFELPMHTVNLIRIVGILVDNAIESCTDATIKQIYVSLKVNEMIIGNTYNGNIDLEVLQTPGYSSKGPERGVGLHSLKYILKKYPDIIIRTSITNDLFLQKVVIK